MAKEKSGSLSFDEGQYEILMRCSEKEDMSEWNRWRNENPDIEKGCVDLRQSRDLKFECRWSENCYKKLKG